MSYTSSRKTKMLVEGGLVIAMAQILSMYVIYQMPQGGAVKAANLVPLLLCVSLGWSCWHANGSCLWDCPFFSGI